MFSAAVSAWHEQSGPSATLCHLLFLLFPVKCWGTVLAIAVDCWHTAKADTVECWYIAAACCLALHRGACVTVQVRAILGGPKGKDAAALSDDETIEKCLNEVEAALNAGLNFKGKFNSGLQVMPRLFILTFLALGLYLA